MTKKIKTLITGTIVDKYMRELEKYCDITVAGWIKTGELMGENELISAIKGAEIIIVEYEQVTKRVIESSDTLKLIVCPRGTPVNIDYKAAAEKGIPVVYAPGRNANSVAEYIVSSIINISRQLTRATCEVKNGRFLGEPVEDVFAPSEHDDVVWSVGEDESPFKLYKGYEICGRTIGFIGFGAVGARTCELLRGMEMRVIAFDPYCAPAFTEKYSAELMGLDEVFEQSDFISVNCAVTPETTGMIGEKQFSLMKPTAYLINTARGCIIRQKDLVEALQENKLAGAVLDVFWSEPLPCNHPLISMPNVIITPHIAGASYDVPTFHSKMVAEEIGLYASGRPQKRVFKI
jgi:D-3-phosphoglycerate dehydrogenase